MYVVLCHNSQYIDSESGTVGPILVSEDVKEEINSTCFVNIAL